MPATIHELFAFLTEDQHGREGLLGLHRPGVRTPLLAVDREEAAALAPQAERLRQTTGQSYRILRFGRREDITDNLPKRSHKDDSVSAISVVLTTDEDGDEEIVTSPDRHLPLACLYPSGLRAMIAVADSTGQRFRVVRFSGREEVTEEFLGPSTDPV